MRSISLHWTASDYAQLFSAYHFCLTGDDGGWVNHTRDLRENMREVGSEPERPYAAHTHGRNSWSIGLAVAAMGGATPADFGAYPVTDVQLDALCTVAARLAAFYRIDAAAIRTHAEAALDDGYFGADDDDSRWDIARTRPSDAPLGRAEAVATGNAFRRRIAELIARGSSSR